MSKLCLHCQAKETDGHKICEECHNYAGDFLERNITKINAIPDLRDLLDECRRAFNDIPMKRLPEGKTTYDLAAAIGKLQKRIV